MVGSLLGNRVRRVEDPELINGRSTYVDDLRIPGTAHAVFVRSPLAHAHDHRPRHLRTPSAAAGVLAVHTAETLGTDSVPSFAQVHELVGPRAAGRRRGPLRRRPGRPGRGRDPGPGRRRGRAGRRRLRPARRRSSTWRRRWRRTRRCSSPRSGSNIAESVRAVHPADAGDVAGRRRRRGPGPDREPADRDRADRGQRDPGRPAPRRRHRADGVRRHPAPAPDPRPAGASYTGLAKDQVRVVAPHVGGAFGGKAGITYHHGAVVAAARALGRPVAWTETRSEAMLSMHGARPGAVRRAGVHPRRPDRGAAGPQRRRLRRVRRLRRLAGGRADAHHGPGALRDPAASTTPRSP